MAVKIHQIAKDQNGKVFMNGTFDGVDFSLKAHDGLWHLNAGPLKLTTQAWEANTESEARSALYMMVARYRESKRPAVLAYA